MRYYARRWSDSRGDAFADWGPATYYFETDGAGVVVRQVEFYDGGQALRYDHKNSRDDDGTLSDQPLDFEEFQPYSVTKREFEAAWARQPSPRQG